MLSFPRRDPLEVKGACSLGPGSKASNLVTNREVVHVQCNYYGVITGRLIIMFGECHGSGIIK